MKTYATTSVRHSASSTTTRRRTTTAVAATLIATVAVLSASGCSALFVNGPPAHPKPHETIDCTQQYAGPVVDGLLAGFEAARTIYAATQSESAYRGQALSKPSDILIGAALTGLFTTSMGVGISRINDCRDLIGDGPQRPAMARRPRPPSWAAAQVVSIPSEDDDDETEAEAARHREEARAAANAKAAGEAARTSLQPPAAAATTSGKSRK